MKNLKFINKKKHQTKNQTQNYDLYYFVKLYIIFDLMIFSVNWHDSYFLFWLLLLLHIIKSSYLNKIKKINYRKQVNDKIYIYIYIYIIIIQLLGMGDLNLKHLRRNTQRCQLSYKTLAITKLWLYKEWVFFFFFFFLINNEKFY